MISPLTGEDNAVLLSKLDPANISKKWKASLGIDLDDKFGDLISIDYWYCPTTGFRWYTPNEAAGEGKLYEQLEKFEWYYMKDKWEFGAALAMLQGCNEILEVGVGEGNFLQLARNKGHLIQGVELNPKGATRARDLGFDVHERTLQELRQDVDKRFDAVCSFQVLEHVSNPREFIEGMIGLLKPGGKLVLSVPNAAVMRRIDPNCESLLDQPPHHMGHWDEGTFASLERLLPVRLMSTRREPLARYHISWFVNGYLRNLLSPLGKSVARLIVNRYSTLPIQWLIAAGLCKFIPGHTLLVEFRHLGDH